MSRALSMSIGRICLGVAVSAGLGWLVTRGLDWGMTLEALAEASPAMIALAVAVFMGASYLRAARWRALFVNETISTNRLFVIQNVGIGLNNVVPIRVASETFQFAALSLKEGVRPSVALAAIGMERVLDLVVSIAILAVAFFLIPEMRNFAPYVWVWGAIGVALASVLAVRLLAWGGGQGGASWVRRLPFLESFTKAVRDLERERTRLAISATMTFAFWLLTGITAWILANSIDLSLSPVTATMVIMVTIFFATSVPGAPAAVGTFEFAMVYILEFFGVSRESGFGFAVLTHAVFFLPPTIMAAIFLPREGMGSLRKLRARADRRSGVARDQEVA